MTKKPLLVIVGPTAVGKTALSVRLARDFDIEIISADSRQIYRGLDIGTAKATPDEIAAAPHHMIDVADPDEILSVADFQESAYAAIDQTHQREHLPVLVGGTGQWIQAVVEGWTIPRVPPDMTLRAKLEAEVQAEGSGDSLYKRLVAVDPAAAEKIHPNNVRRTIRALEVYEKTGTPISEHQAKRAPHYHVLQIGLTMPREQLYERIDKRIDMMMAMGLVEEVRGLMEAGYGLNLPAMSGLGYRQIGQYLTGDVSLDEAVALIKKETRRFVRQQFNWFRLEDPGIRWFAIEADGLEPHYQEICQLVETALLSSPPGE
ncbi:MAG: tRNA (adenosine(37)-N6)-dimethylallyltransferase MiaA [Anaerolineae bacterium]|nr:tRNA (adenosine(37)-N6)-dimethylallyltransferase MiaA [Anaerolineae bacterium]